MAPPRLLIRLDDGLDELAQRILSGEIAIVPDRCAVAATAVETTLDLDGLQGLARLCDTHHRPVEAARIRRWLGAAVREPPR